MIFEGSVSSGIDEYRFEFEANSLEEFKTAFLKRFGNFRGTKKAEQERPRVKRAIKQAEGLSDVAKVFVLSDRWSLELRWYK